VPLIDPILATLINVIINNTYFDLSRKCTNRPFEDICLCFENYLDSHKCVVINRPHFNIIWDQEKNSVVGS
jgi:hypothetical protein